MKGRGDCPPTLKNWPGRRYCLGGGGGACMHAVPVLQSASKFTTSIINLCHTALGTIIISN
jgi:hypothetical protein